MRDSVRLGTDIYLPSTSNPPWPVLLQRTPYDRHWDNNLLSYLTDVLGYALVVQNLRGYGDSEGEPTVFFTDGWGSRRDGYDAVEWIADQVWAVGGVGMIGSSAHGISQYLAAGSQPPHLTCALPMAAAPSLYQYCAFPGGEFRKALVETWLTGLNTPWLIDSVARHYRYDSLWSTIDLSCRWDSVSCPIFHMTGWYDIFTDGQLEAFSALQSRRRDQKLFVGPWGHNSWNSRYQGDLIYPENAVLPEMNFWSMVFSWYDHWLKDTATTIGPTVTFYLMGDCDSPDTIHGNHWVQADTWPLPGGMDCYFYFQAEGILDSLPPPTAFTDTFLYNPDDPCPTYGGREFIGLYHGYGPINQQPIENRSDVLIYTTPVLNEPLTIVGKIKTRLYACTDGYDTDWTVRITDVYPDGRSILVTDNVLKARHRHGFDREDSLIPNQVDTFLMDTWSTAQVFNAGHRLRVIVSSSNYPRFEYNPNTGAPFIRNDPAKRVARQQIFSSSQMPSGIILPVIPGGLPGTGEKSLFSPANAKIPLTVTPPSPILKFRLSSSRSFRFVAVYDAAGRMIWENLTNRDEIALPGLPAGVYFIYVREENKIWTGKGVVIR